MVEGTVEIGEAEKEKHEEKRVKEQFFQEEETGKTPVMLVRKLKIQMDIYGRL